MKEIEKPPVIEGKRSRRDRLVKVSVAEDLERRVRDLDLNEARIRKREFEIFCSEENPLTDLNPSCQKEEKEETPKGGSEITMVNPIAQSRTIIEGPLIPRFVTLCYNDIDLRSNIINLVILMREFNRTFLYFEEIQSQIEELSRKFTKELILLSLRLLYGVKPIRSICEETILQISLTEVNQLNDNLWKLFSIIIEPELLEQFLSLDLQKWRLYFRYTKMATIVTVHDALMTFPVAYQEYVLLSPNVASEKFQNCSKNGDPTYDRAGELILAYQLFFRLSKREGHFSCSGKINVPRTKRYNCFNNREIQKFLVRASTKFREGI
jgi:hypothetical protein